MPARSTYPQHIEKAMQEKKTGIYKIARETGISPPTVSKILLGDASGPPIFREAAKQRIAKYLGISVSQI